MASHSFPVPNPLYFNTLVIFSSKNVKRGHKIELTYLYARWIMRMSHHLQIRKWVVKGGQKCFYYWEVWNPVSCHGKKTVNKQ